MVSSNIAAVALFVGSAVFADESSVQTVGGKQALRGLGRELRHRGRNNYSNESKNKSNKSGNSSNKGKGSSKSKDSDKKRGGDNLICYINNDPDDVDDDVEGLVSISYNGEYEFFMQLQVYGLGDNLYADEGAKVYIDRGTSCNDLDGPLYDDINPWPDTNYSTWDDDEGYSDSSFLLNNGLDAQDNAGQPLVITDTKGIVEGCCVLELTDYILKAKIRPLSDNSETKGFIYIEFRADDTFKLNYYLENIPDDCGHGLIRVMDATNCNDVDEDVDSYYDTLDDPWTAEKGAIYESDNYDEADGSFSLYDGISFAEHIDRPIVVYDDDRKAIGCGILKIAVRE